MGRDVRTIRRWETNGWLTFTLDRVRESDLLNAEKRAREGARRGGRKSTTGAGVDAAADIIAEEMLRDENVESVDMYLARRAARRILESVSIGA